MRSALVIAFAIGCGGGTQKPAQPAPQPVAQKAATCDEMSGHLTMVMQRDDQKASAAEVAQVVDVYKLRCGEDRWGDEVRACYGTIKVDTEVEGCGKLLSPEQKASFDRALIAGADNEKAAQDKLLEQLAGFADQACKCKPGDQECAKKVSEDMTRWAETQAKDSIPNKSDPRIDAAAEKLSQCITAAITMKPEAAPAAKPERKTRGGAKPKPAKSSSDPDLGGEGK